jgi:hypothetical protein
VTRPRSILVVVVALFSLGIGTYKLVHVLGADSASVQTVENKIENDLDLQLIAAADSQLGPTQSLADAAATAPSATVTCPQNARLTPGSVFYCDAAITTTHDDPNFPGQTADSTVHRQVRVTFGDGGGFSWELLS